IKRVAVVEAEYGDLRQQGVVNAETLLVFVEIEERDVLLARVGVVEHRVAMAEGAAFAVLSAETHGAAFEHEGAEGEGFGEAPVDRTAVLVGLGAVVEEALDLGVNLE